MEQIDYNQISDLVSKQINDSFGGVFQYFAIGSLILASLIVVIWIINSIRKWMVQRAVFDIRDNVREMNERQKGVHPSSAPTPDKKD